MMWRSRLAAWRSAFLWLSCLGLAADLSHGGDLDTIGVTLLRQIDPSLTGSGVRVAQAEGTSNGSDFEVNPAVVGQPASLFAWISASGTATSFPNAVGTESSHADTVAANFYGASAGTAPQVARVYNYEANYFVNNIVNAAGPPAIAARVVNQSFAFLPSSETTANLAYDKYVAVYSTIFSSAVGNTAGISSPGSACNSLGVGLYGAATGIGPTTDGRCKPDLVAPDQANYPPSANSYSVPYVAGAAALLLQAGARGDGGTSYSAATNSMTVKALLLNGAIKPSNWTNSVIHPLDFRYGAGVLNVFNSWNQLKGLRRAYIETTSNSIGALHPPGTNPGNEPSLVGWDYNSITNPLTPPSTYKEQVNHYYFQLTGTATYTLTATLTWNRRQNQTAINDLNLFLYNCANNSLVLCSTSTVDNVEHLFLPSLPAGRYDLQVQKNPVGQVASYETYALAFEFFNVKLGCTKTSSNLVLSWPISPAGFRLVSSTSLAPPVTWAPVTATATITNGQNVVKLPISAGNQTFRLVRP